MSKLNKSDLQALLDNIWPAPLITVYMPTHSAPTPPNMTEDRRRFKNLRSRVVQVIKASPEVSYKARQSIERRLQEIEDDLNFWEHRTHGIAIFITQTSTSTFDLPIDCDEYIAVDSYFHTVPLFGFFYDWVDYYVLIVSKKHPMLFSGNTYGLRNIHASLPVAQVGRRHKHEDLPNTVHVISKGKGRQEYFGNSYPLVTKEESLHFYRALDRSVQKNMAKNQSHPLILAGTEEDVCIYRSVSSYAHMLPGHIESANSPTSPHQLTSAATSFVCRAILHKRHQEQQERFMRLAHASSGRASSDLATIRDAAAEGRIETLIVKLVRTTADTVRESLTATPKIHFPPNEQMAAIEYIAMLTWRDHGNIMLINDTATVPPNTIIGAIFRY